MKQVKREKLDGAFTGMKRGAGFLVFILLWLLPGSLPAAEEKIWAIEFSSKQPPPGISVETRYCFSFEDHQVLYARDSSLLITFSFYKKEGVGYLLKVIDRGSMNRMAMAKKDRYGIFSPMTIRVNDSLATGYVDVNWLEDTSSAYDIGSFLKQGENSIAFTLAAGSMTRYEIAKVELIVK